MFQYHVLSTFKLAIERHKNRRLLLILQKIISLTITFASSPQTWPPSLSRLHLSPFLGPSQSHNISTNFLFCPIFLFTVQGFYVTCQQTLCKLDKVFLRKKVEQRLTHLPPPSLQLPAANANAVPEYNVYASTSLPSDQPTNQPTNQLCKVKQVWTINRKDEPTNIW